MTQQIEAMKLALEFVESINLGSRSASVEKQRKAITAIEKALAEHAMQEAQRLGQEIEQEPVGDDWTPCIKLPVVVHVRKQRLGETHVSTREGITPVKPDDLIMLGVSGEEYPIGRAIFEQTYSLDTAPPQRTWVGLTNNEVNNFAAGCHLGKSVQGAIYEAEAKLKEKNT